nr:uncharacterized protein LOC122172292 [Chrysemys picta bellii]
MQYMVKHARLRLRPMQAWLALSYRLYRDPLGSCGDGPWTGSRIHVLVAEPTSGLGRGPLRQAPTFSDVSNRRIRSGLGLTLRGSEDTRLVVEGRETSPYQPEGAQSSSSGLPNLSRHFARSQCDSPDRRQHRHVLCNQTRRSPLLTSLPRGSSSLGLLYSPIHSARSILPSRSTERAGGSPQQVIPHARVVNQIGHHTVGLPKVGLSPRRPLRHQEQQTVPSVLLIPKPQSGRHCRCILNTMGRGSEVCLPSYPACPPGPPQNSQREGDGNHDRPILPPTALVLNPPRAVRRRPDCPDPLPGSDYAGPREPPSPEPAISTSHGVETPWLNPMES